MRCGGLNCAHSHLVPKAGQRCRNVGNNFSSRLYAVSLQCGWIVSSGKTIASKGRMWRSLWTYIEKRDLKRNWRQSNCGITIIISLLAMTRLTTIHFVRDKSDDGSFLTRFTLWIQKLAPSGSGLWQINGFG